jgi:hypothetical protein
VEYRSNTIISSITYKYKYTQNMYPNAGVVEEPNGEGKIVNNGEIHHNCVETSHSEAHRKLLNNTRWKKSVRK